MTLPLYDIFYCANVLFFSLIQPTLVGAESGSFSFAKYCSRDMAWGNSVVYFRSFFFSANSWDSFTCVFIIITGLLNSDLLVTEG